MPIADDVPIMVPIYCTCLDMDRQLRVMADDTKLLKCRILLAYVLGYMSTYVSSICK